MWYEGRTGELGDRRVEPLDTLKDLVRVSFVVVAPWLRT